MICDKEFEKVCKPGLKYNTCSLECSIKRSQNTMLEKYGAKNPSNVPQFQKKREATFIERFGGSSPHCSKEVREKTKRTNKERYGKEYVGQVDRFKEKIIQTNLEKYGTRNPMQNEKIKSKVAETNLEKYGNICSLHGEEQIKKKKKTWKDKYGTENPMQSKEFRENVFKPAIREKYGVDSVFLVKEVQDKIKATMLENHGVEKPFQSEVIMKKAQDTLYENYGVYFPSQSDILVEKAKNTFREKYGVDNPLRSQEIQEKARKSFRENHDGISFVSHLHIKNLEEYLDIGNYVKNNPKQHIDDLAEYFNVHPMHLARVIRDKKLKSFVKMKTKKSKEEKAILNYLSTFYSGYISFNDRSIITPLELDIYLPDLNLAIEISPTFTHKYIPNPNELEYYRGVTTKDYHYNKYRLCKEKGIDLITLFDFMDKEIIKDRINKEISLSKVVEADNSLGWSVFLENLGYKIKEEKEIEIHKYTKDGEYVGVVDESSDSNFDYVYDCGKIVYEREE